MLYFRYLFLGGIKWHYYYSFVYRPTRIWYIKINNRSILGGITLASGTLLSLVTLLFIGLDKIYLHFKNGDLITLAIAYLLIPAVFIGICLYFILTHVRCKRKKAKVSRLNCRRA